MAQTMSVAKISKKNLSKPDETRSFPKGKFEVLNVGDLIFGKATFEPGWRWSECVKPIAGTNSCMVSHNGFVLSGRLRIKADDGTEIDLGPGDAYTCLNHISDIFTVT
jgi:hypothetical protein